MKYLTIKGNNVYKIMSYDIKTNLLFCYHKDSIKEPNYSNYDREISFDDLLQENKIEGILIYLERLPLTTT